MIVSTTNERYRLDPAYNEPLPGLEGLRLNPWTRRTYLTVKACQGGAAFWVASEAVASTALAHGWDLDEVRTWDEWEEAAS